MPRACPVEFSRSTLPTATGFQNLQDATGLPRGVFTFDATNRDRIPKFTRCHGLAPWSFHVGRYQPRQDSKIYKMPRACPVEFSRWTLPTATGFQYLQDATGLPRGVLTLDATNRDRIPIFTR